jgi:tetratricopeptide (TPR) repeat protein
VWQAWALMEKQLGQPERARQLFERGTQADPSHAPVWQAWALMEKQLGQPERARQLFERGTQADPSNAPTWQAWALMEKQLGQPERARQLFERGTQADPSHAPTWQAWALMEKQLGQPERARQLLDKSLLVVHDVDGRANLLCTRGRVLDALGHKDEAEKDFREALRLFEREYHNHYFHAIFLESNDRKKEAIQHYQRAAQLRPREEWMKKDIEKRLKKLNSSG